MTGHSGPGVAVGVADHAGWAILMTATADGRLLDRRRVTLVETGLPVLPHHHDAQHLPVADGVALVERVARSAARCARAALEALAAEVDAPIERLALRARPALPPTIALRLADYRAQCVADTVLIRDALAAAATERRWTVSEYEPRRVLADAARALGVDGLEPLLAATHTTHGRPWQQDHRVAMAAAIAAAGGGAGVGAGGGRVSRR